MKFQYQGVATVKNGRAQKVHLTNWIVEDPKFNPEHYGSSTDRIVMAETVIGNVVLPDYTYILNASGHIDIRFDDDNSITVADVVVSASEVVRANEAMAQAYAAESPQRAVFVDVNYKRQS